MNIYNQFYEKLDDQFHEVPDTFKKITNYVVISQAREMGPEPIGAFPKEVPDNILMKIAVKSMLMLTAERQGAIRGIPATIPFLEYHAMGVIFLFDVADENARGGAYDSCISILVDESYRPAIYENMFYLENICIDAAEKVRANEKFDSVINHVLNELDNISLKKDMKRRSLEIESLMKNQLKRINKELS
jgi:hypothetical protein